MSECPKNLAHGHNHTGGSVKVISLFLMLLLSIESCMPRIVSDTMRLQSIQMRFREEHRALVE